MSEAIEKKRKDSVHSKDSMKKRDSITKIPGEKQQEEETKKKKEAAGATLIEKEATRTGSVGWQVYYYYFKNLGPLGAFLVIFAQIMYQGSSVGTQL